MFQIQAMQPFISLIKKNSGQRNLKETRLCSEIVYQYTALQIGEWLSCKQMLQG